MFLNIMDSSWTLRTTSVYLLAVIVSLLSLSFYGFSENKKRHPDAGLNISQFLDKYSYPLETHRVITEDGYHLALHRIPYGRVEGKFGKRIPILFMHGILQSSIDFVLLGPNKSLSLLLADKGYDVWLGNARGNSVSRGHDRLDPDTDRNYWNFSGHELGFYDVAASIDYILNVTKEQKLHCIGFSQGAQSLFVLTSERPEYAKKIRLITAMAPAIYLKDTKSPLLQLIVYFRKYLFGLGDFLNFHEFFDHSGFLSFYLKQICDEDSLFVGLCLHHFYTLHGYDENTNKSLLSVMISNVPSGMSFRQLHHLVQLLETGSFQRFDFGVEGNLLRYSNKTPPPYDLSRVIVPTALYYAQNDWTVNTENIHRLCRDLPNVTKLYKVPDEFFNHNAFVYGDDVAELVYKSVIEEIEKH